VWERAKGVWEERFLLIDKRNTRNKQNVKTQRDRNTATDMDEAKGQMETTMMRGVILRIRMGSMRMGQGAGVTSS
jgi:hypothetical protein